MPNVPAKAKPVKLGRTYTDSISGFTGIATARYEFLHGCIRVCLERGDKDGKLEEGTFDEQRLTDKPKATSGGARVVPPRPGPAS